MKFSILILTVLLNSTSCITREDGVGKNATDKQKIIYDVIHRSLTQKDMPAFSDLKGQKKILINSCYINFINSAPTDARPPVLESDLPKKIEGLTVELISEEELQKLANETGLYEFSLVLGNIKIDNDSATIAIDGSYRGPKEKHDFKMSGGGGIIHYKKENNVWVFKGFSQFWIS